MSRLIVDADKVQMKLYEEIQNIRHFDKDREKSQIFADGLDFAWVMLDNQPTVKAIPIEWIKNYASHKASKDLIDCYWHFWEDDVLKMVADWEKENERMDNR